MSKISCISLVTNEETKFEQTAQFYNSIGFRTVRYYNKTIHQVQFETLGISNDSIQEIWLENFPLQDLDSTGDLIPLQELDIYKGDNCEHYSDPILIKLRLIAHEVIEATKEIEFFTSDLDQCKALFKSFEDPLGNKIKLTNKLNNQQFNSIDEFIKSKKSALNPIKKETPSINSKKKKIAVMTSGGDSPGMNPAVRAVVRASIYYGCDAFAVYEGYEGLVNDYIKKMEWEDVRSFLSYGGTNIGTARSKSFRTPEGRLIAAKNMIKNGIDALIVCGGDGSLTGADLFRSEWPSLVEKLVTKGDFTEEEIQPFKHLTIVGLVGSIDNDMSSTDATIGAYSALERITEMVDYIDATATSHSRAFVVEVMGRHCGWLGLMSGMSTGADYIFIPERPPKAGKWQDDLKTVVKRHRSKGRRNSTVIVAEGAIDDELNPITSEDVKKVLVDLGLDTRITTLGHVQRGGTAVAYDRMLGTMQGVEAVKAVLESDENTPSPMIGIVGNKLVRQPLMEAVELTKSVAKSIEAKDFDAAMGLRDSNFADGYKQFLHISTYDDESMLLPKKKQLNIGIIHIGASSSGLNASTRAITLYCLSKGHKVIGIQNGFHGLINQGNESMKELSWIDVANWYNKGGSELGTNRSLPSENFGKVAFNLQSNKLDGLIIIGGFESFTALHQLNKQRKNYPIFNIPMIVIPATVSNNVPGSEYSLGCDTCLNQLVNYCDAVKQSASSTRRRVFIVEVQGGHSGYVASFTGVVTGSIATYTPEEKINLKTIQEDLDLIFDIFANDRGEDKNGKIIIRNELSSKIYDTELISDILRENGKKRFETRTAIPGHVQQGFTPSSMDRIMAINFGIKSMEFIEQIYGVNDTNAENIKINETDDNHVVIGLVGSKIEYNTITELYKDANIELRKGNTVHWKNLIEVGDILSGRLLIRENKNSTTKW